MNNSLGSRILYGIVNALSSLFNIKIRLKYFILILLLCVGGAIGYTYSTMLKKVGGKDDFNEAMRYIEIKDTLDERFIDEVDRASMGDSAAASMVSGLGDKWSYFMSADEYKTHLLYSSNEYSDIGMSIVADESGKGFQVISVNMSSPAAWAGLSAGMYITAVDGEDVTQSTLEDVRTLIRSKMNGVFTLTVNGRDVIEVDCASSYVSSVNSRLEKTQAGYVQIYNFEAGSGQDAINAIEELMGQGASALVIDLRGNSGGLISEAEALLDYLLPNCTLFAKMDKSGKQVISKSDSMCVQLPMCVLVNGETYSEAELVAAVLQENQWATILGEATSGKTRIQENVLLSDGSAIHLSTQTYITGNGVDICKNGGVVPDYITFNSDPSATGTTSGTLSGDDGTASTSNDEQLMTALKLLS